MKAYKIFACIAVIIAILVAGSIDYQEEVIYNMPDRRYKTIVQELGGSATSREIVKKYESNKSYYDSIK